MKKYILILFVLAATGCLSFGAVKDSARTPVSFSTGIFGGTVVKNYPNLPSSRYSLFFHFSMDREADGSRAWHAIFGYPRYGLDLVFGTFGNHSQLGEVVGLVPHIQFNSKAKRPWVFKLGMGVSFFNQPFNQYSNPDNLYIGARLNNMSYFQLGKEFGLGKKYKLFTAVSTLHCSDGHVSLPNVGMNFVLGSLTLERVNRKMKIPAVDTSSGFKSKRMLFRLGMGFHEFGATTKATGGPVYPSYHITTYLGIPHAKRSIWYMGITAAYYLSFYDYIQNQNVYTQNQRLKSITVLFNLGCEWVFGKVGFVVQPGLYVYNPFFKKHAQLEDTWNDFDVRIKHLNSNRLGLVYYPFKNKNTLTELKNQLQIGLFLKANMGQADLIETTLGFVF